MTNDECKKTTTCTKFGDKQRKGRKQKEEKKILGCEDICVIHQSSLQRELEGMAGISLC